LRLDLEGTPIPAVREVDARRRPATVAAFGPHEEAACGDADRRVVEIAQAIRRQTRETLDFLIIETDRERNYYVQFPCPSSDHPSSLYCEAVSDKHLAPEDQLGEAGAERLRSLGWLEPEGSRENWYREFTLQSDSDFDGIAVILVQTLRQVYGYRDGDLAVKFG
jgi:hypothetical protein